MEIYEFSDLPHNEKYDTLWLEAEFIVNVRDENYGYNLYSLEDFFVEVRLDEFRKRAEIPGMIAVVRIEEAHKIIDGRPDAGVEGGLPAAVLLVLNQPDGIRFPEQRPDVLGRVVRGSVIHHDHLERTGIVLLDDRIDGTNNFVPTIIGWHDH